MAGLILGLPYVTPGGQVGWQGEADSSPGADTKPDNGADTDTNPDTEPDMDAVNDPDNNINTGADTEGAKLVRLPMLTLILKLTLMLLVSLTLTVRPTP